MITLHALAVIAVVLLSVIAAYAVAGAPVGALAAILGWFVRMFFYIGVAVVGLYAIITRIVHLLR